MEDVIIDFGEEVVEEPSLITKLIYFSVSGLILYGLGFI